MVEKLTEVRTLCPAQRVSRRRSLARARLLRLPSRDRPARPQLGVSATDVKKLKEAGFYTIESLFMRPRKARQASPRPAPSAPARHPPACARPPPPPRPISRCRAGRGFQRQRASRRAQPARLACSRLVSHARPPAPPQELVAVKGLSDTKVDKIFDSAAKVCARAAGARWRGKSVEGIASSLAAPLDQAHRRGHLHHRPGRAGEGAWRAACGAGSALQRVEVGSSDAATEHAFWGIFSARAWSKSLPAPPRWTRRWAAA